MIKGIPEEELLAKGSNSCSGCGAILALRHILKACGKNTIATIATGCMSVVTMPYPHTSWYINCVHSAFENAAATASGISRALKMQKKDAKVIAIAGDGGTLDIGIQALSGALERKEKITFICYDNEAYMNTGIQRSGATEKFTETTTTPYGSKIHGKLEFKKPMPFIIAAHNIPYVATANIAYPLDLINKVKKALELQPSYVQILCPCIPGWKIPSDSTIDIAKLAFETNFYPLYEIENNKIKLTKNENSKSIKEYLKLQGRFKNLNEKEIQELQDYIDEQYKKLEKLSNEQ